MSRRLRVLHVVIQAQLVWDDGDELTPGPQPQPISLPPSGVAAFLDALPGEVARLEQEHN